MESVKDKQQTAFDQLKDRFQYTNRAEAPTLEKIVINVGTGSIQEAAKEELIQDRLTAITGQHPVRTHAKQSVAAFRLREGQPVGYQVTLRGSRMYQFLDKLLHIAVPRMKDFHGLKRSPIDEMGNYTLGVKEHTIFPETSDEELKNVFGMGITIVTTARTKPEAEAFLEHIGMPFEKQGESTS